MGKYGHSFLKTIIKPFYNHFGRCEILLRDIRIIVPERMFQCASITKWPKTGTFTLHMFGYCTEVNVHIDRETSLIFKYSFFVYYIYI